MIVKELANFIVNLKYNDLDEDIIKKAELCFIDYIAVYLKGKNEIAPQTIKKSIRLIDQNYKHSMLEDALFFATAAHVLDLDDGHDIASVHLGAIAFSTAIAMSLKLDITGREFIEAIVVGYETGILIGSIANPNHRNQGFHSTGTIGTLVSGAVASKILRLNLYQTIQCLGICGTQSAGLLESDHRGTMAKAFHAGNASRAGIVSAFLAYNGFTGTESIIDGEEGFLKAMAIGNLDSENPPRKIRNTRIQNQLDQLGKNFQIEDVYFKVYPFCRHIHSSIESALFLHNTIKKDYLSIDSVDIYTYKIASEHNNYNPSNIEELRQSLPMAVAIALIYGDVSLNKINYLIQDGLFRDLDEIDDNKVKDIKYLANKVKIYNKDEYDYLEEDARPSNVKLILNEEFRGGVFEHTTIFSKGNKRNPISPGELIDKFRKLNPNYRIDRLNTIDHMESSKMAKILKMLLDFDN
ncbi:MmgE/PrpD family protein [uncultured Methanobrevibacter sp.]|uniref:MmgE/PrpD family protein n=1 Tax=uncultured Methanobrevibacter sp. TaxID=253161 RepID=UPI0025EE1961|nr:MmgE/PrpD family protein [uncultured Methanobrevibacter sp.]